MSLSLIADDILDTAKANAVFLPAVRRYQHELALARDNESHPRPARERYLQTLFEFHSTRQLRERPLYHYVVFLLWCKLRNASNYLGSTDPVLGPSTMLRYFEEMGYPTGSFEPLLAPFFDRQDRGSPGDLRQWLTRHGYSANDIDTSLHELDAETGEPPRIPWTLRCWAGTITLKLIHGTCDCPESFTNSRRARRGAEGRCSRQHFLAGPNMMGRSGRWDPCRWVERAVTGGCTVWQCRGFGGSMFCREYTTPRGTSLRIKARNRGYVLTDTRS